MQIVFLILKILLLTLAIVLGILLLLILLLLFVPFRYRIDADFSEGPKVKFKVTWLAFLVNAYGQYENQEFFYYVKSLFILLATNDPKKESVLEAVRERKERERQEQEEQAKLDEILIPTIDLLDGSSEQEDDSTVTAEPEDMSQQDRALLEEDAQKQQDLKMIREWELEDQKSKKNSVWYYIEGFFRGVAYIFTLPAKLFELHHIFWCKIEEISDNIKESIQKLLDKLKLLNQKKDQLIRLCKLPTTKTALQHVKGYLIRLWKIISPKKMRGWMRVGLEDPAATGQLFGLFGVLLPLYHDKISLKADFENKVFIGQLHFKGRVTIISLLLLAFKVYRDRYVMKTYERFKKILGGNKNGE